MAIRASGVSGPVNKIILVVSLLVTVVINAVITLLIRFTIMSLADTSFVATEDNHTIAALIFPIPAGRILLNNASILATEIITIDSAIPRRIEFIPVVIKSIGAL